MATQIIGDYLRGLAASDGTETDAMTMLVPTSGPLKKASLAIPGYMPISPKNTNTAITATDIAAGRPLVSYLPGNCVWRLPTMADMGIIFTGNVFPFLTFLQMDTTGGGQIQLNPAVYRGTGTQAQMLALNGNLLAGDYFIRTDDSNRVHIFDGVDKTQASSWTKVIEPTAANAPTAAGIVIDDPNQRSAGNLLYGQYTQLWGIALDHWLFA